MSVSILWKLVEPTEGEPVHGTSNDLEALRRIWPNGRLSTRDVDKLLAMHIAARLEETLWGELAHLLDSLPEGAEIEVWGEY
jgi:hypothetical protein